MCTYESIWLRDKEIGKVLKFEVRDIAQSRLADILDFWKIDFTFGFVTQKLLGISKFQAQILAQHQILHKIGLVL